MMTGVSSANPWRPASSQPEGKQEGEPVARNFQQVSLSEAILNDYLDGILVLTRDYQPLYTNAIATQILTQTGVQEGLKTFCQQFVQDSCGCAADSACLELSLSRLIQLQFRARWIMLDQPDSPCLMVTIIDHKQSSRNLAIEAAKALNLTPSETKVYCLYRASCSYQEIANELVISINTVKKHMKNIHMKRKMMQED